MPAAEGPTETKLPVGHGIPSATAQDPPSLTGRPVVEVAASLRYPVDPLAEWIKVK